MRIVLVLVLVLVLGIVIVIVLVIVLDGSRARYVEHENDHRVVTGRAAPIWLRLCRAVNKVGRS